MKMSEIVHLIHFTGDKVCKFSEKQKVSDFTSTSIKSVKSSCLMYGKERVLQFPLFLFPDHCLLIPRTIWWLPASTAHVPSSLRSLLSPGGPLVHQHPQPVHLPHPRIPHGAPAHPGLLPLHSRPAH